MLHHMGIPFNFQTAFSLIYITNFKFEFSDSKSEFKELGDYIAGFFREGLHTADLTLNYFWKARCYR